MADVLVSACLIGENCKYDGSNNDCSHIHDFLAAKTYVAVCPEVLGGLSTPRLPAEVTYINEEKRVLNKSGTDVTNHFKSGAEIALKIALENQVQVAILKSKSPSCGIDYIFDGTFSHKLIENNGLFVDLLSKTNIILYSENSLIKN
jgi:uncharacterized protein YbbK (DUF523 family)